MSLACVMDHRCFHGEGRATQFVVPSLVIYVSLVNGHAEGRHVLVGGFVEGLPKAG